MHWDVLVQPVATALLVALADVVVFFVVVAVVFLVVVVVLAMVAACVVVTPASVAARVGSATGGRQRRMPVGC